MESADTRLRHTRVLARFDQNLKFFMTISTLALKEKLNRKILLLRFFFVGYVSYHAHFRASIVKSFVSTSWWIEWKKRTPTESTHEVTKMIDKHAAEYQKMCG